MKKIIISIFLLLMILNIYGNNPNSNTAEIPVNVNVLPHATLQVIDSKGFNFLFDPSEIPDFDNNSLLFGYATLIVKTNYRYSISVSFKEVESDEDGFDYLQLINRLDAFLYFGNPPNFNLKPSLQTAIDSGSIWNNNNLTGTTFGKYDSGKTDLYVGLVAIPNMDENNWFNIEAVESVKIGDLVITISMN